MRYEDLADAIGNTPLVGLPRLSPGSDVRLWVKLEGNNPTGSVKDRIAKAMVDDAEKAGRLVPGDPGRAVQRQHRHRPGPGGPGPRLPAGGGHAREHPAERRQLLELYGAEVVLSPAAGGSNGAIAGPRSWPPSTPTG